MKQSHKKSLKFHTLFSIFLAITCGVILAIHPSWLLAVSCALLVTYVAGNGIIHSRKNQLSRDSLVEYCLVAFIACLIIIGALLR